MRLLLSVVGFSLVTLLSVNLICDPVDLKNVMGIRQIVQVLPTPIFDCGTAPIAINTPATFALTQNVACDIVVSEPVTLLLNGYTVNGTITVNSNNVTIDFQEGWVIPTTGAAIEIAANINNVTILNGNILANQYGILTDGPNKNIVIKNINIQDSGLFTSGSQGIVFNSVNGGLIENCIADSLSYAGMYINNSSSINMYRNMIRNMNSPNVYAGLYILSCQNINVEGISIQSIYGPEPAGIAIEQSSDCSIHNGTVIDTQGIYPNDPFPYAAGVYVFNSNDVVVDACEVLNTQAVGSDMTQAYAYGIDIEDKNFAVLVNRGMIQSTQATSNGGGAQAAGINMVNYTDSTIADNTIQDTVAVDLSTFPMPMPVAANGIHARTASRVVFMSNKISTISATGGAESSLSSAGIALESDCLQCTIDRNEIANSICSKLAAFSLPTGINVNMGPSAPYANMVLRNRVYQCGEAVTGSPTVPVKYTNLYDQFTEGTVPFAYTQGTSWYNFTLSIPAYFLSYNVDADAESYL